MIDLQTELEQVPQSALELIRSAVSASLANGGVRGDVCVLITDAEEIQSLNRTYRKIDRVTDVLTFPAWEGEAILCRRMNTLAISQSAMSARWNRRRSTTIPLSVNSRFWRCTGRST